MQVILLVQGCFFRKAQGSKILLWVLLAVFILIMVALLIAKNMGDQSGLLDFIFGAGA